MFPSSRRNAYTFWLGGAAVLLVLEIGGVLSLWREFSDRQRWSFHTHEVVEQIGSLFSSIQDAETGQRGYLLTQDETYLRPFYAALEQIPTSLNRIQILTADDFRQRPEIIQLESLTGQKLAELRQTVELRQQGRVLEALRILESGRGQQYMDRIRALVDGMKVEESSILSRRNKELVATAQYLSGFMAIGAVLLLIMLLAGSGSIGRQIALRQRAEKERASAERKRAEEELTRQAEMINLSHDAIITTDPNRIITGWNRGAVELYGWTEDEAQGQFIHDLLKTTAHIPMSEIDASLPQNGRWDGELTHVVKDGGVCMVESRHILLRDNAGEPAGILEINRNVTDRKHVESDLYRASRDLDNRLNELRSVVKQKDVLFREVQHRVKNNLQVISSLLALEAGRFEDSALLKVLEESRDRVRSMALVHEKFCHTGDLAQIDFGEYIDSLVAYFFNAYASASEAIRVSLDVDVKLAMNDAVPCGLIIQELLSNSMKHAFPDGAGEIRIEFHDRSGELQLRYRDTGVGLPLNLDLKTSESLGLQLVTDLVDQLGGHLEYRYDGGALFVISFEPQREHRSLQASA